MGPGEFMASTPSDLRMLTDTSFTSITYCCIIQSSIYKNTPEVYIPVFVITRPVCRHFFSISLRVTRRLA